MSKANGNRLQPTVMPTPVRSGTDGVAPPKARVPVGQPAPIVLKPTAIAGAESRRLVVDAAELQRLSPETGLTVTERSLSMLSGFMEEKASERRAILWQQDLQKAYSAAVGKTLALSQSPLLSRVQVHVSRMMEILRSFDIASATEAEGTITRVLKRFNARIDTAEEFANACSELERLKQLLQDAMDPLLKLREEIEDAVRMESSLSTDIEAAALAALYLSQHFKTSKPALADRYLERSMSLTATLAQIRSSRVLHDLQSEHPVKLVNAIQQVTLVAMPDFLISLSTANSNFARKGSINPTEASELQHKLQDLIQLLKH